MKQKIVKVRKERMCCYCGESILKGTNACLTEDRRPVYEGYDPDDQTGIKYFRTYMCTEHIPPPPTHFKSTLVEGKSATRVHSGYKIDTKDWQAQYDMLLPDGITCKNCRNCDRCVTMFGSNETDTSCQWYPSRYIETQLIDIKA